MPDTPADGVERRLPTDEARELLALVCDIARREIAPSAAAEEAAGRFPANCSRCSPARAPRAAVRPRVRRGGQPYEVYLQVLEELAAARLTVGLGVSVHTLSCHALAGFGTGEQRTAHLPAMLGGGLLGAYCLSEPSAGSDAAALRTRAVRDGDAWTIDGTKAWITHGGIADFYTVMARTGGPGARGITAFLVPGTRRA